MRDSSGWDAKGVMVVRVGSTKSTQFREQGEGSSPLIQPFASQRNQELVVPLTGHILPRQGSLVLS